MAPSIEEQQQFSRIVKAHRTHVLAQQDSEFQLGKLFSSLQQRAFRGELDTSLLTLEPKDDSQSIINPDRLAATVVEPKAVAPFLKAPQDVETALQEFDKLLRKDGPMPWSPEYFKYRIVGTMPVPFSFGEIMTRANGTFNEEPPYDEIKDIILELLGKGGRPALLSQKFDLEINDNTNKVSGRKEIVFEPVG